MDQPREQKFSTSTHRGVPRYAAPDRAAALKDWFQVDVEVREPRE